MRRENHAYLRGYTNWVPGRISGSVLNSWQRSWGCLTTTVLGIAGAVVAKYAGQALGFYGPNQPSGFLASVGGAVLLLVLFRLVRGKKKS